MTPTTSSASGVLLNPGAPTAKAASSSTAETTPGAAVSGFELLLDAVRQLQEQLASQLGNGNAAAQNANKAGDDSGNESPPLGMILPSLNLPQPRIAGEQSASNSDGDKTDKNSSDKSDQTGITLLGWINNIAAQSVDASGQAGTDANAKTMQNDGSADNKTMRMLDGLSSTADKTAAVNNIRATDNGNNVSTAANAAAALLSGKTGEAAAKTSGESDFDALMKHFDVSTNAQSNASANNAAFANASDNIQPASRGPGGASNNASIQIPVGGDGWSDAVADKVMWFSANKISSAEIHLNPPDLGPLQVRVSTQHDQASVVFTSQHAAVRDALDQALPRLRDMMGSQGMHLLDVSVGGQNQQQQQQAFNRRESSDQSGAFAGLFADDTAQAVAPTRVTTINAARFLRPGVDAYV